jgi:hypothetical protein
MLPCYPVTLYTALLCYATLLLPSRLVCHHSPNQDDVTQIVTPIVCRKYDASIHIHHVSTGFDSVPVDIGFSLYLKSWRSVDYHVLELLALSTPNPTKQTSEHLSKLSSIRAINVLLEYGTSFYFTGNCWNRIVSTN